MSKGKLALFGSGEFTKSMIGVDKFLLENIESPKIAILPIAAGSENAFYKWIKKGESYYKNLGYEAKGFQIRDSDDCNFLAYSKELEKYNYFVFSGGDPGYLLKCLSKSLIWDVIYNKYLQGSVIVGSSAGAMALGKKVWGRIYDFDKKGVIIPWDDGLGILDFGILPHFDMISKYFTPEQIVLIRENMPDDIQVVGIGENTAYIKTLKGWVKMGNGEIVKDVKKYFS